MTEEAPKNLEATTTGPDYRPTGRAFFREGEFDCFSLRQWIQYFIVDAVDGGEFNFYRGKTFHIVCLPQQRFPADEISAATFVAEVQALYDQGEIEKAVMALDNYTFYRK